MADHRALSRQANPILTNIYPAFHRLHGQVQHVAFLTVLLVVVVYSCVSYLRTLMWLVMTSKADIGEASLGQWEMQLCKVKCNIHNTSTHSITMWRTIPPYLH